MIDLVWLVPALPLTGAIVALFGGRRAGRNIGWLASALVAAAFAAALGLLLDLLALPSTERARVVHLFDWIRVGDLEANVDLLVDPLSVTMALVVTGVGALIHVYAIGYMEGDPRYGRFFSHLNLFVFFMLLLILADNYLLLYVGWEGVGLCSYLLIGFWFERPAAASAAKKAFVTTRIGDTAFLVGIALMFVHFGSVGFDVFGRLEHGPLLGRPDGGALTAISLLLLAGAIGKSAQVPLHVWLPDAMEGPTPVSALIHAATMVTAGVYLVVRSHALFEASEVAIVVVMIVGLLTALYAGISAIGQDDIKRVLAYSTISQVGFMFLAAGMKAYAAAILLLVTHAFYKALMFLSAGSVMHGLADEADLKRMGGLRRAMPLTAAAFAVGALALSGIPPLAGFFSKDQIVAEASRSQGSGVWTLALLASFVSALYISRLVFLAFAGGRRSEAEPHESPRIMTVPLGLLAIGAALSGAALGLTVDGALSRFLEPVVGAIEDHAGPLSEVALATVSVVVAISAVATAWIVWGSGRVDWQALRAGPWNALQRFMNRGMYVDDAYAAVVEKPAKTTARGVRAFDERVIDGAVNGMGAVVRGLAAAGRRVQTGVVRSYAAAFLLGALAVLVYVGSRL
jgi:NADH-quinone oxidoreductase subunit L